MTAHHPQGNVALPLSGIPSGGGRRMSSAWGRSDQTHQRLQALDERSGACAASRPATQIIDATPTRSRPMRPVPNRAQRGFTLIELMFSVTIAGFLSSVAYPAYQGTVQKVRRSDALVALMDLQMAQERFRSNNIAYGSLAELRSRATSPSGHYQLDVQTPTGAGFIALATAAGSQRSDAACGVLKLTVDGANVSYASGSDGNVGNDSAANKRCWSL